MKIFYTLSIVLFAFFISCSSDQAKSSLSSKEFKIKTFDEASLNNKDSLRTKYIYNEEDINRYINDTESCGLFEIGTKAEYNKEHLPNAILMEIKNYMHMFSDEYGGKVHTSKRIAQFFSKDGVRSNYKIILYDNVGGFHAHNFARIIRMYGHDNVAIYNGNKESWKAKSYEVSTTPSGATSYGQFAFQTKNDSSRMIEFPKVLEVVKNPENNLIIDCRTVEEYKGLPYKRNGQIVPWEKGGLTYGRIPNSIHLEWSKFVDLADGKIKTINELNEIIKPLDLASKDNVILYSHAGTRSEIVYNILNEILGYKNVQHYTGSWIDYSYKNRELKDIPITQELNTKEHSLKVQEIFEAK